jgi:hypothetical protein
MNPDRAATIEQSLTELDGIHDATVKSLEEIDRSKKLTTEGKTDERTKVSATVATKLQAIEKRLASAAANAAQVEREIENKVGERRRPTAEHDFLARTMLHLEVREQLRPMDPVEAASAYREAARTGPDIVVDAIELSPLPLAFVTPALRREVYGLRAARICPDETALLVDLRHIQSVVGGGVQTLKGLLRERGLRFAEDDEINVGRVA